MTSPSVKLEAEVSPHVLTSLYHLADREGKSLNALMDEALTDFIEKRQQDIISPNTFSAPYKGHDKFAYLFSKVAG